MPQYEAPEHGFGYTRQTKPAAYQPDAATPDSIIDDWRHMQMQAHLGPLAKNQRDRLP